MSSVASPLNQNQPVANIRQGYKSRCWNGAGNSSKVTKVS